MRNIIFVAVFCISHNASLFSMDSEVLPVVLSPNVSAQDSNSNFLLGLLDNALPSNNTLDKEVRRANVKHYQGLIDQMKPENNEDELSFINAKLQPKNLLLTKDSDGKLIILDKELAFERSYASRFNFYLKNTNEKSKEIEVLGHFVTQLLNLNFAKELSHTRGIRLLDIGAGNGDVALPIAKILHESGKTGYIGVERDNNFLPIIKEKFDNLYPESQNQKIPYTLHAADFRKIIPKLSEEPSSIALISHLYTTTAMNEFLPMVFSVLEKNGVVILAHDTGVSDAAKFRALFPGLLKQYGGSDYTETIDSAFKTLSLDCKTISYESSLTFPELGESEWKQLEAIKQADYENSYSNFSENLKTTKNLIDFVLSDKLESFPVKEMCAILGKFKLYLLDNNHQFKSTCKIQIALAPNHTLECGEQFLHLKNK